MTVWWWFAVFAAVQGVVLLAAACIHTDPPARRLATYQPRAPHPN